MSVATPVSLVDIDSSIPSFDERQELKEAVCDALVNLVHARTGGIGPEGETVFAVQPQAWFVSDFLLNRFDQNGKDRSSDIRIAVHGMEFKIRGGVSGTIRVKPSFAVYVRVLPSWEDISNDDLQLRPSPRLKSDVRKSIFNAAKEKVDKAVKEGDKHSRRDLLTKFSREIMEEKGIKLRGHSPVLAIAQPGDLGESYAEGTDSAVDGSKLALVETLATEDEVPDNLCVPEKVPLKCRRLQVDLSVLDIALGLSSDERDELVLGYSKSLVSAVEAAYRRFIGSQEGLDWAWRPRLLSPNAFTRRERWEHVLADIRAKKPDFDRLYAGQDLRLSFDWAPDPFDPSTVSVRIALEHVRGDDLEGDAEPGLFQVSLDVELPREALVPFALERVKPSYAIAGYMDVDAAGVNCGVVSKLAGEDRVRLRTTWVPRYYLPRIVPNEIADFDVSYRALADRSRPVASLSKFADEFTNWIWSTEKDVDPLRGLDPSDRASRERETEHFKKDLEDWRREVDNLRAGLALLAESEAAFRKDPASRKGIPYKAWLLMNRTFLEAARRKGWDERKAGWRLFQLGFVVSGLTAIATRMEEFHHHYDAKRDERVSLLYFATGGGKSEAFFGLLIFALFVDRLRGKLRGVTALMRYPLRLLTAQQARRLARLLAEAEVIKSSESITGASFEIGFWVGGTSTPNKTVKSDGKTLIDELADVPDIGLYPAREEKTARGVNGYREALKNFNKLHECPFCREPTALRIYPKQKMRLGVVCLDEDCRWNVISRKPGEMPKPLPFLLVDTDIYRRAPAILLGTVDKLALLGQHVSTINRLAGIFGLARWVEMSTGLLYSPDREDDLKNPVPAGWSVVAPAYDGGKEMFLDPVPSLIIQDEAHLLEESLGTFAGLFETTLYHWFRSLKPLLGTRMASVPGAPTQVRLPKVIAATATISDPVRQVQALYQREVERYPQPGPELHNSYYASPRRFDGAAREREGWAERISDREWLAPWARVYVSLITNGGPHTSTTVTVLAAFTAVITRLLRDLTAADPARRPRGADLMLRYLSDGPLRGRHEQALRALDAAGRHDAIASVVDLHRVALTYVTNKKGGDQILSALGGVCEREHRLLGTDFAITEQPLTKLISGGVESGEIEDIVKEAERSFDPTTQNVEEMLRMIVATSAISHGVDVERFNSMFFAGMPTNVAEYIQASSRVGRTHVGFIFLIPTPQARRDRYVAEVHETFHRFLERMISPPAIERWASRAVRRVIPSIIQNYLAGVVSQEEFKRLPANDKVKVPTFYSRKEVCSLKQRLGEAEFKKRLREYVLNAIGVNVSFGGAGIDQATYQELVSTQIERFSQDIDEPFAAGNMHDFWNYFREDLDAPMMSLRDVDAPGTISSHTHDQSKAAREGLKTALQFVRDGRLG